MRCPDVTLFDNMPTTVCVTASIKDHYSPPTTITTTTTTTTTTITITTIIRHHHYCISSSFYSLGGEAAGEPGVPDDQ